MTHTPTFIDLDTGLTHTGLTTHENIGFELGWDYAHYRLAPPSPYAEEPSPLRHGWLAGQATFGARTLVATRHARKWLQLRLGAWLRGRSVELVQVTPNYLQQIEASHCPITRVPMVSPTLEPHEASVDRVRNDAGYAAGNLAMMSAKANHAKAAWGRADALRFVQQIEAENLAGLGDLDGSQWARVAVLCSFVETMPHAEACAVPLLVLPPNRLRLFNPVQALQAFVSLQFLKPGWSQRISRFEDLLPSLDLRRDFKRFFMTLLPRVIEGGLGRVRADQDGARDKAEMARWAIEDAWRATLVQQRWVDFASKLTPEMCESLLARALARRLATTTLMALPDAGAIDGWNLDTRGYVPHARDGRPSSPDRRQAQAHLAW